MKKTVLLLLLGLLVQTSVSDAKYEHYSPQKYDRALYQMYALGYDSGYRAGFQKDTSRRDYRYDDTGVRETFIAGFQDGYIDGSLDRDKYEREREKYFSS